MRRHYRPKFPLLFAHGILILLAVLPPVQVASQGVLNEAPAGFDNLTNGFVTPGQFQQVKAAFEAREESHTGLGPVYNAQSCAECHANPVTGGSSQITILAAGRLNEAGHFIPHPGGSIIHSRATDASLVESVLPGNDIQSFRISPSTLGQGFVECIPDATLIAISDEQGAMTGGVIRGEVVMVPVREAAPGTLRAGRFGWKCQNASLQSFAAGAYLVEMGITSPLQPNENTSNGRSVAAFDPVPDPEDDGGNVLKFATFMRATKAPPRDENLAATPDAVAGEQLFNQVGCTHCHRPSIATAAPGTLINGGTFKVPPALGNKIIRPYGDFLLHDIGTGDGTVANGPASTREKVRTAPLWGLRTRNRLMHDGASLTFGDAISRHKGEATFVAEQFWALSSEEREQIFTFLKSL